MAPINYIYSFPLIKRNPGIDIYSKAIVTIQLQFVLKKHINLANKSCSPTVSYLLA